MNLAGGFEKINNIESKHTPAIAYTKKENKVPYLNQTNVAMSCLIKKNNKKDVVGQQKNIFGRGHSMCMEGDRPCNEGGGGGGGEGYTRHAKN